MSVLEVVRSLHDYNAWANGRLLSAMDGMSDADLLAPTPVPLGNLRRALWHTISAQMGWLSIISGVNNWSRVPVRDSSSVSGLRELFDGSHELWREYLGSLDEAGVLAAFELPMDDNFHDSVSPELLAWSEEHGHRPRWPAWQSMLHVVNHSTQHRAEIGMYLHSLGCSPGDLDYGTFEEDRAVRESQSAHTGA